MKKYLIPATFLCLLVVTPALAQTSTVTVVRPNGGEILYPGQQQIIQWSAPSSTPTVSLYLLYNQSMTSPAIASATPNTGSYLWTVPAIGGNPNNLFQIYLVTPGGTDRSDGYFTINSGPFIDLKVNGGNGPVTVAPNTPFTLSWLGNFTRPCPAYGFMPGWGGFKQVTSNVIGSTTISLPAYSAGRTYNPSLYCTIWSGATTSTIVTDSVRVNVIGSTTTLISRAESLNLIAAMLEAIRNLLSTLGR